MRLRYIKGCSTTSTLKPHGNGINNVVPRSAKDQTKYPDNKLVFPFEPPQGLIDALIVRHSTPRDLVCDPYLNSGYTAMGCVTLVRRFIGAEDDEKRIAYVRGLLLNMYQAAIAKGIVMTASM
jgi:hypothetical protein